MDKLKPFEIISSRFQISGESAKYFLIHVQKSFKTEKPPQQVIIDFMQTQEFKSLPRPHQVAAMLNAAGIWAHPLNAEPAGPVDEEDIYF